MTSFEILTNDQTREVLKESSRASLSEKILKVLRQGPLGSAALRERVGGNGVECDRAVQDLARRGAIYRAGPKKPWTLAAQQDTRPASTPTVSRRT